MHFTRPLRIALVSRATSAGGGASRMAEELAALLKGAGMEADHWVGWYSGPPRPGLRQLHGNKARPLVRLVHKATAALGLGELLPVELATFAAGGGLGYDLVHFHDIALTASPLTVRLVAGRVPTAWTFHDCSPFTGGCIQPMGCTAFTSRCGSCPERGAWPLSSRFDRTGLVQDIKRRVAGSGLFAPVAPSHWMAGMAAASGMFRRPVRVIPNGVDTAVFRPFDKSEARGRLGLPEDRAIVLLVSGSLEDRYKGVLQGIQAIRDVADLNPMVLAVGRMTPEVSERLAGLEVRASGYLKDRERLALHYAAADALLYPTKADNMPLVVLEAMACGTAVVAFAVGGLGEMIEHGQSGWLAKPGDVAGLVQGLRAALAGGAATRWGRAARQDAVEKFSHAVFLANHLGLYAEMLAATGRHLVDE